MDTVGAEVELKHFGQSCPGASSVRGSGSGPSLAGKLNQENMDKLFGFVVASVAGYEKEMPTQFVPEALKAAPIAMPARSG